MNKFDWQATESAPKDYPMQVVSGDLYYPDGGSLYVPNRATVYIGWGKGRSSHLVGPDLKPLPARLDIIFFSYTENQFYQGSFDLPYEKILNLFNDGYFSPKEEKRITYHRTVVGMAPGGAVAVWLTGIDKTTEIFFGKADKADLNWKLINDNPDYPREKYVQLEIEDSLSPEKIEALNKNGIPFGRWENYRTRYHWQPVFTGMKIRDGLISRINYFNGENGYLYYPLDKENAASTRAIPSDIHFVWERGGGNGLRFRLYFNETEITDAFEKLGKQNTPLRLEMRMETIDGKEGFTLWLRNDKEDIRLVHTNIKTYSA